MLGLLQSRHCEGAQRLKQSPGARSEIASDQTTGLAMTRDGVSSDFAAALQRNSGLLHSRLTLLA